MEPVGYLIAQSIVEQTHFLSALSTAIFGATVALRLQIRLSNFDNLPVRWSYAFWITVFCAIPAIGMAFVISGLVIELIPVLYFLDFSFAKEFSSYDFSDTRITNLEVFSQIQVYAFVPLLISSGAFVLRNIVTD